MVDRHPARRPFTPPRFFPQANSGGARRAVAAAVRAVLRAPHPARGQLDRRLALQNLHEYAHALAGWQVLLDHRGEAAERAIDDADFGLTEHRLAAADETIRGVPG